MAAVSHSHAKPITVSNCFNALGEDQNYSMSVPSLEQPRDFDDAHPQAGMKDATDMTSSTAAATGVCLQIDAVEATKVSVPVLDEAFVTSSVGAENVYLGSSNGNKFCVNSPTTKLHDQISLDIPDCNNISEHPIPSDDFTLNTEQNIPSVSVALSQGTHTGQVRGHPGSSIGIIAANEDHNPKGNNAETTAQNSKIQNTKVDMDVHILSDQIGTVLQQNQSIHSSIAISDHHALDRIQQITEQMYLKQVVQAIKQAIVQERIQGHELNDLADFSPNSLLYGDFVGMEDKSNNSKSSTVCSFVNSHTVKSANGDVVAVPAEAKLSSYISKCNTEARKRLQTRSCRDYDSSDWTEADTDDGCDSEEEEEDNNGALSYCDELDLGFKPSPRFHRQTKSVTVRRFQYY